MSIILRVAIGDASESRTERIIEINRSLDQSGDREPLSLSLSAVAIFFPFSLNFISSRSTIIFFPCLIPREKIQKRRRARGTYEKHYTVHYLSYKYTSNRTTCFLSLIPAQNHSTLSHIIKYGFTLTGRHSNFNIHPDNNRLSIER